MNPIRIENNQIWLLDQRKIPQEEIWIELSSLDGAISAIRDMVVRGAPLIGFTAIFGLAFWIRSKKSISTRDLIEAADKMKNARPTAVNLMYEVDRVIQVVQKKMAEGIDVLMISQDVFSHGENEIRKLENNNSKMAQIALDELSNLFNDKKLRLMTHCNTGRLACGTIGTALGVIEKLNSINKLETVWVDETRPYLQGSRLTSFELIKLGIHHRVVVEGAASFLMRKNLVDAIFVGADRIVANGDVANKIGTSNLAIVAKNYNIPFYVVAPLSSFDFNLSSGNEIEIELRSEEEILSHKNHRIAHEASKAFNPSFDITSATHITGIISEYGIIHEPNSEKLKRWSKIK